MLSAASNSTCVAKCATILPSAPLLSVCAMACRTLPTVRCVKWNESTSLSPSPPLGSFPFYHD